MTTKHFAPIITFLRKALYISQPVSLMDIQHAPQQNITLPPRPPKKAIFSMKYLYYIPHTGCQLASFRSFIFMDF